MQIFSAFTLLFYNDALCDFEHSGEYFFDIYRNITKKQADITTGVWDNS